MVGVGSKGLLETMICSWLLEKERKRPALINILGCVGQFGFSMNLREQKVV